MSPTNFLFTEIYSSPSHFIFVLLSNIFSPSCFPHDKIFNFSINLFLTSTFKFSQVLSEDEARRAVAAAVRLQAGIKRFDTESSPLFIPPSVTIQLPESIISEENVPVSSEEHSIPVDDNITNDQSQSQSTVTEVETPVSVSVSESDKPSTPVKSPRLKLSYWALDTALSAVFKGPNPRLGRPSARTKVRE